MSNAKKKGRKIKTVCAKQLRSYTRIKRKVYGINEYVRMLKSLQQKKRVSRIRTGFYQSIDSKSLCVKQDPLLGIEP